MNLREDIEYMFTELGKSVGTIANALNTTRGNVYYHINQMGGLEKLHKIRVQKSLNIENIQMREEQFLAKLIGVFESHINSDDEDIKLEPKDLIQFSKAYSAITSIKNQTPERIIKQAKQDLLTKLQNLAIQQENMPVLDFLSSNAELIVSNI